MPDYLDQLTAFVCESRIRDFPENIILRAKEVFTDTLAVIAAGAQEPEVKGLTTALVGSGVGAGAAVIGAGIRCDALKAALINGTAGTFLELDEGNQFGRGHAGIQVIPAIFAVADAHKISGKEMITALIVSYDIAIRIGIACQLRMSMHPHGTWGTVGAGVAVGKLMGYSPSEMKKMISVSASMSTATNRQTMLEGGTVRNVYSGLSSHNGLLAHHMIKSGFTGERDGLQTVFGAVVSESFSQEAMVEDLGSRYEIGRNYFKRYACCRYNHSAIDATNTILEKVPAGRIRSQDIVSIEVATYSLAAQLCDRFPRNTLAAKFSIPFALATRIVNGHAGISSFTQPAVNDPVIAELAQKVTVVEDPELTAMMPDRRPSRVRITLASGQVLQAEAFINKGDTEDPYSAEEIQNKYYELVEPLWGRDRATELHRRMMSLADCENFNLITGLITS